MGAYVLAGELAAAGGDHTAAFPAYQRRLAHFVAANQKIGRDNAANTAPNSRLGVALQALAMVALPHLPGKNMIMRRVMRAVNELDLPDYSHLAVA